MVIVVCVIERWGKAEVAEREVRSIVYQMKVARFPTFRDLVGFNFIQSDVNEALVRLLYNCEIWLMPVQD